MIKIVEPFIFDNKIKPIQLFNIDETVKTGETAVICGWGSMRRKFYFNKILRSVKIKIIDNAICKKIYESKGYKEGQICAGDYEFGGKDACDSDSGGPLVVNGRLAGIISYGISDPCGQPKFPGAYTEISYHRRWINEHALLEDD